MRTEAITLQAADGVRLEGRLLAPEAPVGAAVICHPHPRFEGSMSNVLVPPLWRALEARGWIALRFNFRGVGRSEGEFTNGPGETMDARGALDLVASMLPAGAPLGLAGWSFGSLIGLSAAVGDERVVAYAGIAPPVRTSVSLELPPIPSPAEFAVWRARVLFACGTDDPFCSPRALERFVATNRIDATIKAFEGEDHFFSTGRDAIVATVADFLTA